MKAEIKEFIPVYLDRITQLTNKTNQFNLTTKRYTMTEIENMSNSSEYITLYGRLVDKFGDNGLVSVIVGNIQGYDLHINLWLMSCRVLKRDFEVAMFQELLKQASSRSIKNIYGYYYETKKNAMVKDLYCKLGFTEVSNNGNDKVWVLDINEYRIQQVRMKVNEE